MDRFYRRILEGLEGHLDPEVFEACVCDLLRDGFPGLMPIRGSADAGMDGAIADGEGEAYPLACTTSRDVIGNLTESLDSYLGNGGRRRRVVLATSQPLTPTRRRNLEERARERGLTLVQIVEQESVAQRLRWSPVWCHNLGIPWEAAALSAVPKTRRPLLEIEPVGREKDLEWLRSTTGDRVLSGQPGSGKTFLLYKLVKEGWGLFLVDDDRQSIAEALAAEKPPVVVIDDAHVKLPLIDELRQLREDVGHPFDVVATTWEGDRERVVEAMGGLAPAQVNKLELLTREEILEVYRRTGVESEVQRIAVSPADLMRHLIDQAANKPGLAVTLATILLHGGKQAWEDVLGGKALHRTFTNVFRDLVGEQAETLLACFALGGDRGMAMEAVAAFVEIPLPELRIKVVNLAAGGVLSETGSHTLAVWPRTLRPSLLRSVFFRGSGTDLDFHPLFENASSRSSAVEGLVVAAGYGVPVPQSELRRLVVREGSTRAWQALAASAADSARWVLQHYPGGLADIARAALDSAPELAIQRLLEAAARATPPHAASQRALGPLADWIRSTSDVREALTRRRQVANAAKRHLEADGDRAVAMEAFCLSLSPSYEAASRDPGVGRTVTIRWGLLHPKTLAELPALWDDFRGAMGEIDSGIWLRLKSALWEWIYPESAAHSGKVPESTKRTMHDFAAHVLHDLAPLVASSPGLSSALDELARQIDIRLEIQRDPIFELLYPPRLDHLNEGRSDHGDLAIRSLADQWGLERPLTVAHRIAWYEREGEVVGRTSYPRGIAEVARHIAKTVPQPERWLSALTHEGLADDLRAPFLDAVIRESRPRWQSTVLRCLDDSSLRRYALALVLSIEDPPAALLQRALETAESLPQIVEHAVLRGAVPAPTLKALLVNPSWKIALAAAVGEWLSEPKKEVRAAVAAEWRAAILRAPVGSGKGLAPSGFDSWLGAILANDPELACQWILTRLREGQLANYLGPSDPFTNAIRTLHLDHRRAVLDALPEESDVDNLIRFTVGRDLAAYSHLLGLPRLRTYHLEPLHGVPDAPWTEMALLALRVGHSAEEIARASFHPPHFIAGSGIDYWDKWERGFAVLEGDPRSEVQEIARHGSHIAQAHLQRAREEEREVELLGV
jgi:hypothetical protein